MKSRVAVVVLVLASVLSLLSGCQTIRDLLALEKPEVTVDGVRITSLDFNGAELTADIRVSNPNPIGISMAGFSYDFQIENTSFVAGDLTDGLSIESYGDSVINVPVSFDYGDVLDTYRNLADADEAGYRIDLTFRFELPVLGVVSVPVSHEGTFPVLRVPRVQVSRLKLDSIGLAGADLAVTLKVENPNGFAAQVPELDFTFAVQEQEWIDASVPRGLSLPAKGDGEVTIPFRLSFLSFGRTLRDLLMGDEEIRYALEGRVVIDLDLDLIGRREFPFSYTDEIPLSRN